MVTKWFVKFVIDVWVMDIEGYGKTNTKVKKLQFNVQNVSSAGEIDEEPSYDDNGFGTDKLQ